MIRIVLATSLVAVIGVSAAITTAYGDASPNESGSAQTREWRGGRAAIFEARLVGLKAALALTPDQEKNWSGFETALRDLAKARGAQRRAREDAEKDSDDEPSPIDRMRQMSERLDRRALELKSLADASAPLYASFDDKQKLIFRTLARDYWRSHRGRRRD